MTCGECGQEHTRGGRPTCTGHVIWDRATYQPGQPRRTRQRLPQPRACMNPPMRGLPVCRLHGGAARQARAKGTERVRRAEAEKLMVTLGEPIAGAEPGEVVAERISVRAGHVAWLLARVRELEPDALTWGRTREKMGGDDYGTTEEAKPHVWYVLYTEASRELERLCIEAIRVGLDERRVRVAEQYASVWVRLIDGLLRDLGHDPNDPETAAVVARHLEAIAA